VGRPFGLGLLGFLLLGAERAGPDLPGRRGRRHGKPKRRIDGRTGFVMAIALSLALSVAGLLAQVSLISTRDGGSYTYDDLR
jgi:hypothetical protein